MWRAKLVEVFVAVALTATLFLTPVGVAADGPVPTEWPQVERSVVNGWETLKLFCREWGEWGYYLTHGWELLSDGVRTILPSEARAHPGARYVVVVHRYIGHAAGAAGAAAAQAGRAAVEAGRAAAGSAGRIVPSPILVPGFVAGMAWDPWALQRLQYQRDLRYYESPLCQSVRGRYPYMDPYTQWTWSNAYRGCLVRPVPPDVG